jgi:hypothetical protein
VLLLRESDKTAKLKRQKRAERTKQLLRGERDAQDGSILAEHVLSTCYQPSCATSHLLQARGEMLSILMMRTVEMVF